MACLVSLYIKVCFSNWVCTALLLFRRGHVLIIVRWWTQFLRLEPFTRPAAACGGTGWGGVGWGWIRPTRLSFVVWERVRWKVGSILWRFSGQPAHFTWLTNVLLRCYVKMFVLGYYSMKNAAYFNGWVQARIRRLRLGGPFHTVETFQVLKNASQ